MVISIFDPETKETLVDLSKLDKLTIEQLKVLIYETKEMLIQKVKELI